VVRTGDDRDPTAIFENALRGYPPGTDLAQALVERALDDGSETKLFAAFGHAYTDREGIVYPGVTLYDAHGSGVEIEMPDVDSLGLIHDIDGEWKRWVAPVPATQHDELYKRLAEHFGRARRYRGLRQALAMTYVIGSAALRDSYAGHRDRLHTLWDTVASTPADLVPTLPDASEKKWKDFLEKWSAKVDRDKKLTLAGQSRRAQLDRDSAAVRGTMIRVLEQMHAMERTSRPEPPAPPETPSSPRSSPPKGGGH
jgi:hypothetical protein